MFFIEETKLKDVGKVKFDNYILFEKPRKKKTSGGGIAIGCIEELNPVWVKEAEDDVEALSIEIFVKKMKIRCCVTYGLQENEEIDKQAGTELGQAQLKLELYYSLIFCRFGLIELTGWYINYLDCIN